MKKQKLAASAFSFSHIVIWLKIVLYDPDP